MDTLLAQNMQDSKKTTKNIIPIQLTSYFYYSRRNIWKTMIFWRFLVFFQEKFGHPVSSKVYLACLVHNKSSMQAIMYLYKEIELPF